MKLKALIPCIALSAGLMVGCGKKEATTDEHAGHDHAASESCSSGHDHVAEAGAHDGFLEVGEHVAHIKFDHDDKAGKATLSIFGTDMKTPLRLAEAPVLNIVAGDERKQVKTTALDSSEKGSALFIATDAILKNHPSGRISLKIDGKAYQVALIDAHDEHAGHDHGSHEGHGHAEGESCSSEATKVDPHAGHDHAEHADEVHKEEAGHEGHDHAEHAGEAHKEEAGHEGHNH